MRFLLDTCTFLWLNLDAPELSTHAREVIVLPESELFLSAASAWEIAIKYALGRLPLPEPPERYVPSRRAASSIQSLPIEEDAALQLSKLPGIHSDPFDRILIAQAIVHGLALLTPDPLIARYPVRTVW